MSKRKPMIFITTFSKYESIQIIGEGGTGYIHLVEDEKGQNFALKVLKKAAVTEDRRKRFKNEIIFCQRSSHPNIISVLDYGIITEEDLPIPFYIMPLYESSLRQLMQTKIEHSIILSLVSKILDGVEAAHMQGVVHRDLKPENILIRKMDSQLVIADFGIASFQEEELYTAVETKAYDRLANFQYAAPEQRIRGTQIDTRADIYAIGLIMNEMFTGQIPQGTGYRTISAVATDFVYLDEIVASMIHQAPIDRPQSISSIKELLKAREAELFSQQRLSKLKSIVIPASEINDLLVDDPIKIIDFEWEKDMLTLILNHPVNDKWISALQNMGSYTAIQGKHPKILFSKVIRHLSQLVKI